MEQKKQRLALGADGELRDAAENEVLPVQPQLAPQFCPTCGTANLPTAHYCRQCGTDLFSIDAQMTGLGSSTQKSRKVEDKAKDKAIRELIDENDYLPRSRQRRPRSIWGLPFIFARDMATLFSVAGMMALTQIFVQDGFAKIILSVFVMVHLAGITALRNIFKHRDQSFLRLLSDVSITFTVVGMYALAVIFNRRDNIPDTGAQVIIGIAILFFSIGAEALRRIPFNDNDRV